ncbi:hypothetical protein ACFX1X_015656 [Malus domestica]
MTVNKRRKHLGSYRSSKKKHEKNEGDLALTIKFKGVKQDPQYVEVFGLHHKCIVDIVVEMVKRGDYFELLVQTTKTWVATYNYLVRAQETTKTKKLNIWKTHVERPVGNTKQKKS